MMTPYASPYAARFVAAYEVTTAREIFAWTETHPITANAEWPTDAYQHTGDPREDTFILAVPTPEGLVGFFAPNPEAAGRIRASVF
jgi:lipoprotein-anchoring transpeptidase ErfK/SrfK